MITYDDFAKLEIKIGTIISAEKIAGADKLLKLVFDIGNNTSQQVVAGIAEYVADPAELVGKQLPFIANLEPRTLRGEVSNGMILAVGGGTTNFALLHPGSPVPSGTIVK